jgi:hypothetical protein
MTFNPEIVYPDFLVRPQKKSRALEILELAVGLAVKDGCTESDSVFRWLIDIPRETFINLWRKVFPDLVSKEYFDEVHKKWLQDEEKAPRDNKLYFEDSKVHGGYEQFISNRGTYFLRVYGGNKDMFMNRLGRVLNEMCIPDYLPTAEHIDTTQSVLSDIISE